MKFNFLCEIGIHKWKRAGGTSSFSSNVKEKYYVCARCGKRKTEIELK